MTTVETDPDGAARARSLFGVNAAERSFGTVVTEAWRGHATATTHVPEGADSAGWLGPLADVVVARAAMALREEVMSCLTIDLRIDCLTSRPLPAGTIVAHGTALSLDDGFGLSEAVVEDQAGNLLARCVGRLRLATATPERAGRYAHNSDNELTTQSLQELFGLVPISLTADSAAFSLGAAELVSNQFGMLHGGAQHAVLVVAAEEFARAGATDRWVTLDATVSFAEQIPIAGPPLRVALQVDARSRNLMRLRVAILAEGTTPLAFGCVNLARRQQE